MLKLVDIKKEYDSGNSVVHALKGVSIEFRKNEFVSILGQSGCGKTTLLNIIGGLDRYTSGDLIINGRSTKEYKDHDWDNYRNHSIGFVFQSYNLIPHQTVLANVELALTLSGVSRAERKKRAIAALQRVGLGNQLNKRPNQMSGGQMQRVAIARALINDPEILLADEPTGALDSETSEQIMELLKEVANDRLVIMVTHNPDLADRYSTRIVRLLDGEIVGDSNPYDSELSEKPTKAETAEDKKAAKKDKKAAKKEKKKAEKTKHKRGTSMSFLTALSLSLNNLITKKGRTFMTAFAGSIGIIGIALILSLSSGFQGYIDDKQEEALSAYPIAIDAEATDMSELLSQLMGKSDDSDNEHEPGKVYANTDMYDMMEAYMNPEVKSNDLESFKKWLDDPENEIHGYLTAIQYLYGTDLEVYLDDISAGALPANDCAALFEDFYSGGSQQMLSSMTDSTSIKVFEELLSGKNGEAINDLIYSQYELVDSSMSWPKNKNEVVVITNKNNEISETFLYALGLLDRSELNDMMTGIATGGEYERNDTAASWEYSDLLGKKFRLILPTDKYIGEDTDGDGVNDVFTDKSDDDAYMKLVLGSAEELKVVGIIRPKDGVTSTSMTGAVGYLSSLTDWYRESIANSEAVKYQQAHPDTDIFTGLPFKTAANAEPAASEKAAEFKAYVEKLGVPEKAELYVSIISEPDDATFSGMLAEYMQSYPDRASKEALITSVYLEQSGMDEQKVSQLVSQMTDDAVDSMVNEILSAAIKKGYADKVSATIANMDNAAKSAALEALLSTANEAELAAMYDKYMPSAFSESTYSANCKALGIMDKDIPSGVRLYSATFENKDQVAEFIKRYNKSVDEDSQITYTDYVAAMMSSISTIINVISYVLIAFVSISLVVSSIMIGIITYISVLERTKEIGILRSIGASKRDISRVFNAETLIVGFVAGMIGILVTMLLNIPINLIIEHFSDISGVSALPPVGAAALVLISMLLTFIAGLIPARVAAKKDPVVALRSE